MRKKFSPWYQDGLGDSHGDLTAAGAKLDEAGWTLDSATGKRMKNGEVLTIDLYTYAFRADLETMQPPIGDALDAVGITVNEILSGTSAGTYDDDDWDETLKRLVFTIASNHLFFALSRSSRFNGYPVSLFRGELC